MLDKDAVTVSADTIGYDKKPKEYINWVKNNLNMHVSNSTVTKTLGKYSQRCNTNMDNALLMKAQEFLISCNSNVHYSKALLDRARMGIGEGMIGID